MHEMAIAESLLGIVLDESGRHGITRVNRIQLQVGALAAVVPAALTFCFELISRDTIVADAVLAIETVPVVVRCPECKERFEVDNQFYVCPRCGPIPAGLDLTSGRELTLLSIEGESGDEDESSESPCGEEYPRGQ